MAKGSEKNELLKESKKKNTSAPLKLKQSLTPNKPSKLHSTK